MGFGVVLVVDDEPMVRQYLSSVLHANGFRTVEAASGHEGLATHRVGE